MVKVKREQFIAPVGKEIDKVSAFQQMADALVEHLCHAVTSQARIQLGQCVVENQTALYRNDDAIFSLMKFPREWPSGG